MQETPQAVDEPGLAVGKAVEMAVGMAVVMAVGMAVVMAVGMVVVMVVGMGVGLAVVMGAMVLPVRSRSNTRNDDTSVDGTHPDNSWGI